MSCCRAVKPLRCKDFASILGLKIEKNLKVEISVSTA